MSSFGNTSDLDKLEQIIRKKPSGTPQTKLPLNNPDKYPSLWFDNQEDLDAYDSLMRKKIYFQNSFGDQGEKEFTSEGFKTTFGIFTKEFKERRITDSDLIKKQKDYIEKLKKDPKYVELTTRRYHTWSDFNDMKEWNLKYVKVGLLLFFLRELPLKHFYARAFIVGMAYHFLWVKQWKFFTGKRNLPTYYLTDREQREFLNYPMLYEIVCKKIDHKLYNPQWQESDFWWAHQYPIFYMHHFKHYRYVFRNRREIPWDGTFNQPVFPYMKNNNRTAFVSNGLLEAIEPKGSGNW